MKSPTYLRVVVTTRCNHQCAYCHMEGDPQGAGAPELDADTLVRSVRVAVRLGVRKIKFLGGEPLLRRDLESLITRIRELAPDADLSVITAGLAAPERVRSLFAAGLDRINVTFHGFGPRAFAERVPGRGAWERRRAFIDAVLAAGRPVKCNYVYRGASDREDLQALLDWAKGTRAVVGLLDELQSDLGYAGVRDALVALRGDPASVETTLDPHSLATELWRWSDGLRVELKHLRLGEIAPYAACESCPSRARCGEGIYALRLTHTGSIAPCLDRPELAFSLASVLQDFGASGDALAERCLAALIDRGFVSEQSDRDAREPRWLATGTGA